MYNLRTYMCSLTRIPDPERRVHCCLRVCITYIYTRGCTHAVPNVYDRLIKKMQAQSPPREREIEIGSVTSCRSAVIRDITPLCSTYIYI